MDIDIAKELRDDIVEQLTRELITFEEHTGLVIDSVTIIREDPVIGGPMIPKISLADVEVKM
jgi:hypothetical protein